MAQTRLEQIRERDRLDGPMAGAEDFWPHDRRWLLARVDEMAGALNDSQATLRLLLAVIEDVSSFNLRSDSATGLRRKVDTNNRVLAALTAPAVEETRG